MKSWNPTLQLILIRVELAFLALSAMPPHARAQALPFAHTHAAGPITTTNAVLNGMVVPNGSNTIAWFEWGAGGSYGQTTPPVTLGNGFTARRVSAGVSNLPPFSSFRFRLGASNSLGKV